MGNAKLAFKLTNSPSTPIIDEQPYYSTPIIIRESGGLNNISVPTPITPPLPTMI